MTSASELRRQKSQLEIRSKVELEAIIFKRNEVAEAEERLRVLKLELAKLEEEKN